MSSFHQNLARKYAGNPALLIVAGFAGLSGVYLLGKSVKKYLHRQRRERSRVFADFLYEQEIKNESEK